jgi:drug/metabolite transporter (DMT)-like permease
MVVLTIASALLNHLVPNFMQLLGLIFCIVGALILVIPDKLRKLLCLK